MAWGLKNCTKRKYWEKSDICFDSYHRYLRIQPRETLWFHFPMLTVSIRLNVIIRKFLKVCLRNQTNGSRMSIDNWAGSIIQLAVAVGHSYFPILWSRKTSWYLCVFHFFLSSFPISLHFLIQVWNNYFNNFYFWVR